MTRFPRPPAVRVVHDDGHGPHPGRILEQPGRIVVGRDEDVAGWRLSEPGGELELSTELLDQGQLAHTATAIARIPRL